MDLQELVETPLTLNLTVRLSLETTDRDTMGTDNIELDITEMTN